MPHPSQDSLTADQHRFLSKHSHRNFARQRMERSLVWLSMNQFKSISLPSMSQKIHTKNIDGLDGRQTVSVILDSGSGMMSITADDLKRLYKSGITLVSYEESSDLSAVNRDRFPANEHVATYIIRAIPSKQPNDIKLTSINRRLNLCGVTLRQSGNEVYCFIDLCGGSLRRCKSQNKLAKISSDVTKSRKRHLGEIDSPVDDSGVKKHKSDENACKCLMSEETLSSLFPRLFQSSDRIIVDESPRSSDLDSVCSSPLLSPKEVEDLIDECFAQPGWLYSNH